MSRQYLLSPAGCAALIIDATAHSARLGSPQIREGDWLSIDGGTGAIYLGHDPIIIERPDAELAEVESWGEKSLSAS